MKLVDQFGRETTRPRRPAGGARGIPATLSPAARSSMLALVTGMTVGALLPAHAAVQATSQLERRPVPTRLQDATRRAPQTAPRATRARKVLAAMASPAPDDRRRYRLTHHKFVAAPALTPRNVPLKRVYVPERRVLASTPPRSSAKPATRVASAVPAPGTTAAFGTALPPALPPAVKPGSKIIAVNALELPAASTPLPDWTRNATVAIDNIAPVPPAGVLGGRRLAQNTEAPPLRQPARPVVNSDFLPNQLEVAVSTFVVLLTTTDLQTVSVADPNIADVAVVNARAVLLTGKAQGITSLVLIDRLKIRQYQVRVVPAQGTRPVDIQAAINLPNVMVQQLRDAVVLEGEVTSPEEAKRAVEIAGVYAPKVIDHLKLRETGPDAAAPAPADLAREAQAAINIPGVTVKRLGDNLILEGAVDSVAQKDKAEILAKLVSKNVTNFITTRAPLTVAQVRETLAAPTGGALNRNIVVKEVGDQIILEGTAATPADIEQAIGIAGRSGLRVISNLVVPAGPPAELAALSEVERAIERGVGPGVRVIGTPKRLILVGVVADTNAAVMAEQIARAYAGEVDVMLNTTNPTLVNVDITIVEISKNKGHSLGVELGSVPLQGETFTPGTPTTNTQIIDNGNGTNTVIPGVIGVPSALVGTVDYTAFTAGQFLGGQDILGAYRNLDPFRARLNALYSSGDAHLLSNPTTTVLSGRTVTFQVGGQVPIPISTALTGGAQAQRIEFKDFGLLVDVVPVAGANGSVTMRVRTEVSAIDNTINPVLGVPGFSRRATVTEVSVPPRGTVALSGLIQNNITQLTSKVPILSSIPIIGALFTSKRFQQNQTELVIFVRPTVLPNPLAPGTTVPAGVFTSGPSTSKATILGNGGISTFNATSGVSTGGGGGGGQ